MDDHNNTDILLVTFSLIFQRHLHANRLHDTVDETARVDCQFWQGHNFWKQAKVMPQE